jgi:DNA-binding ferritin-like protein (Dps family)
MVHVGKDEFEFKKGYENQYRRLGVREAARIQTFPDDFEFKYKRISDGYKMIGNAVPVKLAEAFGQVIYSDLSKIEIKKPKNLSPGDIFSFKDQVLNMLDLNVSISA